MNNFHSAYLVFFVVLFGCVDQVSHENYKEVQSEYSQIASQSNVVTKQQLSLLIELNIPDFEEVADEDKSEVISSKVQELLNSMRTTKLIVRHAYQFTPTVLVSIDKNDLELLKENSIVKSISENKLDFIAK